VKSKLKKIPFGGGYDEADDLTEALQAARTMS